MKEYNVTIPASKLNRAASLIVSFSLRVDKIEEKDSTMYEYLKREVDEVFDMLYDYIDKTGYYKPERRDADRVQS